MVGSDGIGSAPFKGFIYDGSTYSTLTVPAALWTEIDGIFGGTIADTYYTSTAPNRGFTYDGSTFTTINVPGAGATAIHPPARPCRVSDDFNDQRLGMARR